MLTLVSAIGLIGAAIFLALSFSHGHTQLELIYTLFFAFMAAAGFVGNWAAKGEPASAVRLNWSLTKEHVEGLIAVSLIVFMLGVFIATLIPALYVMLPLVLAWSFGAMEQERPEPLHPLLPDARRPTTPAYGT
jgi:hypothetical protein